MRNPKSSWVSLKLCFKRLYVSLEGCSDLSQSVSCPTYAHLIANFKTPLCELWLCRTGFGRLPLEFFGAGPHNSSRGFIVRDLGLLLLVSQNCRPNREILARSWINFYAALLDDKKNLNNGMAKYSVFRECHSCRSSKLDLIRTWSVSQTLGSSYRVI